MVWITWPVSSWFTVIWPPEIFFCLNKTWWVPCRLYCNIFQLLHTKSMIGDQFSIKQHCKAQNCHFTVLRRLFLSIALCILSLHDFTHDCSSYLKKWRLHFNNIYKQPIGKVWQKFYCRFYFRGMSLILISYLPDFSAVYFKVNLSLFFASYNIYTSFFGP